MKEREQKKTSPEELDEAFNRMRSQLDYLVANAKIQNDMLKELLKDRDNNPRNDGIDEKKVIRCLITLKQSEQDIE